MEDLAKDVAKKLHAEYWPVSAKSGENIQQMFFRLAALIFDSSMEKEAVPIERNNVNVGTNLVCKYTGKPEYITSIYTYSLWCLELSSELHK